MLNIFKNFIGFFLALSLSAEELSVMSFNVENLFDNTNDAYKNDETYLASNKKQGKAHIKKCEKISSDRWRNDCLYIDWSDEVIENKLNSIAQVILSYGMNGPDIIGLQEVENKRILKKLFNKLESAGYIDYALLEGSDDRGIDTAFISKHKVLKSRLHKINFSGGTKEQIGDTREIFESTFKVEDKEITIFNVHFPAPYNPLFMREDALKTLNNLANNRSGPVLALGDFNISNREDAKEQTYKKVNVDWFVSHIDDCFKCKGTNYYFYGKTWSYLDAIIIKKGSNTKFKKNSVEIIQHPIHLRDDGSPLRYNSKELIGVSDHFPIVGLIQFD